MPTEKFDFVSPAGYRLSGRIELPDAPVRGWALFAHCFTCGKDGLAAVRIGRALARTGIGVLRFDFAGLGGSEGEFGSSGFGADAADLVAAYAAMAAAGRAPGLLIGHSLGGAAALAAADAMPVVKAVATIAAPFDIAHVLHQIGDAGVAAIEAEGSAEVQLAGRPFTIGKAFIDDLRHQDQGARIAKLGRALMVLHAPRDEVVGVDHATRIFLAARHPRSFVSLDDADHLLTRPADAEYVASVIAAWAARYLPPVEETRSEGQPGEVFAEETRAGKFQLSLRAGGIRFLADEPESVGGFGSGPTPYDLLSAALAACTTMTLRLYADQKGLPVDRIATSVGHMKRQGQKPADLFTRRISIEGAIDEAQRARMIEIADRCPVHRTLEAGSAFDRVSDESDVVAESVAAHAQDMVRDVA
jgi:putative redox protein